MLLFYKLATRLSLTTCWQIENGTTWNKSVELNNYLVASCQSLSTSWEQAVRSANTSCWQIVGTVLLQVCCKFVTTCAFLRVYKALFHTGRIRNRPLNQNVYEKWFINIFSHATTKTTLGTRLLKIIKLLLRRLWKTFTEKLCKVHIAIIVK
jgi:hypothetical protein